MMARRRSRESHAVYLASFLLGALLMAVLFSSGSLRSSRTPLHVSLHGRVSRVDFSSVQHASNRAFDMGEELFIPRDRPKPGSLPTQKMMQAGQDNPTKGRNRKGPILGCEQFQSKNFSWPEGMRTVAIVGNGPLAPASRAEINSMDFVVRFNKLQSYVCGDKFDVWASRHGDAVTTRYWGIGQKLNITDCPFSKLLDLAQHIWLMNGGDGPFNHFLQAYPQIKEKASYVWLDCRRWVARYLQQFDRKRQFSGLPSTQDEISPSSGWLVIMMLKDCAPPGTQFHIYGFNWPGGQWPAHKVEDEQDEIRELANDGVLQIHQTLCKHKYHCNSTVLL